MQGLMQYHPLMISSVIEFAATYHGDTEVVSRRVEGDIHRSNYATINRRAKQIANALDAMGLAQSARVGTLAWNGYRHFELYYGVSGSGRVLHTLNPRLHPEQLAWIINHAEDEALCFDMTFLPLVKAVAAKLPTVKHFIALCDADKLPADSGIPNLQSYETWIGAHSDQYVWPAFDENLASSLCYTSGTTGNPKGVLYSHRSTMLHSWTACAATTPRSAPGSLQRDARPHQHHSVRVPGRVLPEDVGGRPAVQQARQDRRGLPRTARTPRRSRSASSASRRWRSWPASP